MAGLHTTAAGAPVGSVQRKLSAGTFHFVIRPIGGAPNQPEGGPLRLLRLGESQRVQIAAHQHLDPRSDIIPLGLAGELSDLFAAKVAQARKLNGAPALPHPATPGWGEKDEPVEAPVTPMLLVDLPDDLLTLILASRTGRARVWHTEQVTQANRHWRAGGTVVPTASWCRRTGELVPPPPADCTRHQLAVGTCDECNPLAVAAERAEAEEAGCECSLSRPITEGHALAEASACCRVFATCAREAAKIVADRHGWRLPPVASGTPMQHLSRLEHDTKLVRSILRQMNELARPLPDVTLWAKEVTGGFIGSPSIDAQVRWQHTLELGRLLILLPMRVGPGPADRLDDPQRDPERDQKVADWLNLVAGFVWQLNSLMTQPGTPLDASWLAACVFPLVEMYMAIENRDDSRLLAHHQGTGMRLVSLLCFLEPSVLRSHPETFEWVRTTLKCVPVHRDGVVTNETAWSAGLEAWNELWEAQEFWEAHCRGCDAETRDARKLKAMLSVGIAGVRGCFPRLSAVSTKISQLWWSRVGWGCEIFPAVYH